MPLPGAADDAAGWSGGGGSARDGQRQMETARDNGFDEALGGDPFASVSGSLQGLQGRSDSEFETIDWTFYQERDRQCVISPHSRLTFDLIVLI